MTERYFNFGSGIPAGWTVRDAIAGADRGIEPTDRSLFENRNLAEDLIAEGRWPVRDQGARGTCNAFAVIATEELTGHIQNPQGPFVTLSEEYFYAAMQRIDYDKIGLAKGTYDPNYLAQTGGTYLVQALIALSEYGACARDKMPYEGDRPVNFFYKYNDIPEDAYCDAQARKQRRGYHKDIFEHDITDKPETGECKGWRNRKDNERTSTILAKCIASGRPVAASFAILNDYGRQAWDGRLARRTGEVRYPTDREALDLVPIAGHSVCLVGVCNDVDSDDIGWFVFRNSYGIDGFASDQETDQTEPVAPAPGYGTISAHDVDRYCWEYLARSSAH